MSTGSAGSGSPDGSILRYTFPKSYRLRTTEEFKRVYEAGQKQVGRHMVVWTLPNEFNYFRAGVVASKRVGNAVKRTRAKRRIRELIRMHQYQLQPGRDFVLVSRYTVPAVAWEELVKDFQHVCERANLFEDNLESDRR